MRSLSHGPTTENLSVFQIQIDNMVHSNHHLGIKKYYMWRIHYSHKSWHTHVFIVVKQMGIPIPDLVHHPNSPNPHPIHTAATPGPPLICIIPANLLEMFHTHFWSVVVGICAYSATRASVRSGIISGVRRPGVQLVFKFVPKVFSEVEVMALCRTLEFFLRDLGETCCYGPYFVHRVLSCWNRFGISILLPVKENS